MRLPYITILPVCITCNKKVQESIDATIAFPDVFILMSSFIVIGVIAGIFYYISVNSLKNSRRPHPDKSLLNPVPLTFAGLILGMGIGGFIDGIVLHQILQWHGMLTNIFPSGSTTAKSVNMFWDGLFHFFTLIVVIIGLTALYKSSRHSSAEKNTNLLMGGFLCGWAIFNFSEGIINHHILKLHNVRENVEDPVWWNFAFLILSAGFLIVGVLLLFKSKNATKAI